MKLSVGTACNTATSFKLFSAAFSAVPSKSRDGNGVVHSINSISVSTFYSHVPTHYIHIYIYIIWDVSHYCRWRKWLGFPNPCTRPYEGLIIANNRNTIVEICTNGKISINKTFFCNNSCREVVYYHIVNSWLC